MEAAAEAEAEAEVALGKSALDEGVVAASPSVRAVVARRRKKFEKLEWNFWADFVIFLSSTLSILTARVDVDALPLSSSPISATTSVSLSAHSSSPISLRLVSSLISLPEPPPTERKRRFRSLTWARLGDLLWRATRSVTRVRVELVEE